MTHAIRICIAAALTASLVSASRTSHAGPLAGAVLDGVTLQPVEGATVTIAATGQTATADAAGRFAFDDTPGIQPPDSPLPEGRPPAGQPPAGQISVRVEAPGYEPTEETIALGPAGNTDAVILLFRPGMAAEVIEVVESAPARPDSPGRQALGRVELTRLPGTRGDALQSIKSLPGVANADAAGAGPGLLVIRGAAPEDSRVTLDGIEIPLLYHFFGLQSIVPSEYISNIEFLPGGFGAEEGRATGGVIRIATRDEPIEHAAGFAELSFINFAGFAQTPLSAKHNLQLSAGLRRSAIDLILPAVIPEDANVAFTTAPYYYDGQLRVDWLPDRTNRVSVLLLASLDRLSLLNDNVTPNEPLLTGKFENETAFTRAIATWRRVTPTVDNRLVVAAGTTLFRFEIGGEVDSRFLRFDSRRLDVRDDVSARLGRRARVRAGAQLALETTDALVRFPLPPQEGSGGVGNFSMLPVVERDQTISTHTAGAYAAVDFTPTASTTVTPGVRLDYFDRIGRGTVTPRLTVVQRLPDRWKLQLALGAYSRAPDQAEAAQDDLEPEVATQYVAGAEHEIRDGLSASASVFYTDRRRLVVQDAAAAMADPESAYVNRGLGRSLGAEALVRIKRDGLFGWLAYTISRSDRVDAPGAERRLFDYDQTHNLIAVASYAWGKWTLGGRWQYNTGSPVTPIVGSVFLADRNVYLPVFGDVNSDRLDTAHQLDVRIDRKWQLSHVSLSAYLDVTNVYAHPKVLGFQYNFDFSERQAIEELPLVPAVGVRGSF